MKCLFLLLLGSLFLGASDPFKSQSRYLPVYFSLSDSSHYSKELILNLKLGFLSRKIKPISKAETMELIEAEGRRVMIPYFENLKFSNGTLNNDEVMRYQAANTQNVANSLLLSIKIDGNGNINDTIKWNSHTVPINMQNFPKANWHYMYLNGKNASNVLQMCQSIVDSIIASNVLVKE
jgi:hypothetical protein